MPDALASSIIDALLALELGAAGQDTSNRFSLEGVTLGSTADGALEIDIAAFEASSFRLKLGPFVVEIGRVALRQLVGQVRLDEGTPRLRFVEAAEGELSGVKIHGPLVLPWEPKRADAADGDWHLGPLAAADGTIRAQIVDAALFFDADVTVPIRRGTVDFNEATVEHVGPDSRMGVSRLGLYVDAPNGRSYLYQFAAPPLSGVEFERRGALLGAWVADRGKLRLQAFVEGLLRQGRLGPGAGFTDEARVLFDRTAVSGDVQLSDGRFVASGVEAELTGRADGRNTIRLHSNAVGRGLTLEMASLSVGHAVLNASDTRLACDALTGTLVVRVLGKGTQLRFEFDVPQMKISGLRVDRDGASIQT